MVSNVLIIGISGVTCGGKTTLATRLKDFFPNSKLVSQDDYFLDVEDPRHTWIPELNHINFDILSSLDMEKMKKDIDAHLEGKKLLRPCLYYNTNTVDGFKILNDKITKFDAEVLIIEGFSIFNYKPLRDIFQLKFYLTLSKEECFRRRNQRVYEPPDGPGYFEACVWPEHLKQLEEVQNEVKGLTYFNEENSNVFQTVVDNIYDYVNLASSCGIKNNFLSYNQIGN